MGAATRSFPLEQGCEHTDHRAERARREIGVLDRRPAGSGVLEDASPTEVVEVVAGARSVRFRLAEARDRAVDNSLGEVARADSQAVGHAGPEALEDDVGPRGEGAHELDIGGELADDRLRPGAERRVPRGCGLAHRVAARRLDVDDPGSQAQQLPARVRTREVAREVDDERPRQRLHGCGPYLYPRAR